MKSIKLLKITLINFMGVRSFCLMPDGKSLSIYGKNGSGKTTTRTALYWLLFGINSDGDSKFNVKTWDKYGVVIPDIPHSVSGDIMVDNHVFGLKKTMTESRNKKKELTGHEYEYSVNGDIVKKTEWDSVISGICTESVFKLLTSTNFFSTLHWSDLRKIVMGVACVAADEDIMASIGGYEDLLSILNERDVSFRLDALKKERKSIEDKLKEYAGRVSEAGIDKPSESSTIPPAGNYEDLKSGLKSLQNQRAALLSGDTSSVNNRITEIRKSILDADTKYSEEKKLADKEKSDFGAAASAIKLKISELSSKRNVQEFTRVGLVEAIELLKAEWQEVKDKPFPSEVCNMGLPAAGHPGYNEGDAIKSFNDAKAESLKAINAKGKLKAKARDDISAYQSKIDTEISSFTDEYELAKETCENVVLPEKPDHSALYAEIEKLESSPAKGSTNTSKIDKLIQETEESIAAHDEAGRNLRRVNEIDERLKSIDAERKADTVLLETKERGISLCEKFIIDKTNYLTAPIDAKFDPLKFRLFEPVSGEMKECCKPMMYSQLSGGMVDYQLLSQGEKAIAGLSVIKSLSEHYQISCPVFIDSAEGVTLDLPLVEGGQYIKLFADKDYPELTVFNEDIG
jgi:predicted  nucleic acid-binding Zn-ribbon protein